MTKFLSIYYLTCLLKHFCPLFLKKCFASLFLKKCFCPLFLKKCLEEAREVGDGRGRGVRGERIACGELDIARKVRTLCRIYANDTASKGRRYELNLAERAV